MPPEAAMPPVATAWGWVQAWTRRLGRALHTSARRWLAPRRLLALLTDRWRRSLQLRVVTATLVLSAVAVSLFGYFLLQRFVADLYTNKERSAANVVETGLQAANQQGAFQVQPGANTGQAMYLLACRLYPADSGSAADCANAASAYGEGGDPYALVVTLPSGEQGPPVFSSGAAVGFDGEPHLPGNLVDDVTHEKRQLSVWTSMAVDPVSTPVAGLLIGAPFGLNNDYQLYYFFPVTAEQASIAAMQRAMLAVGIAAVFLLAGVVWLVTRWVVSPVRLAARGARRLSAGHLDERLEVRGSDEIAALATSFNEMAAGLQEKLQELQELSQVQRQFVSDVSHELRTPLTTIRIAADVLFAAKDEMGQSASRSAELLQSQLERFETLLTDLLEISRYDANAATLDAEPADVCTIVRQSADVAQHLAERRGVRIEFRLSADACIAEVDRRRVERIVRNLLQNAVEHGDNKDIVVTVGADSAAVAVSVRDYGVGLAPGEEHLVFDRFWRADPARARSSGGTGLGLAIALEDARLHGGWLEAWGERGLGSVFRLTLPRTAGGELAGSPLPLRPDRETVDTELVELPDVAGFASLATNGLHESSDGQSAGARRETSLPGTPTQTGISAHG
jgi:two-component system, OmpR family, sensor histidine kinase MtrB